MKWLLLNQDGAPALVDIKDICLIRPTRQGPEFLTLCERCRFPSTAAELLLLLGERGFDQVDRNAIINSKLAMSFDPDRRVVYFGTENADTQPLFAPVSAANAGKLKHLIRESGTAKKDYAAACGEISTPYFLGYLIIVGERIPKKLSTGPIPSDNRGRGSHKEQVQHKERRLTNDYTIGKKSQAARLHRDQGSRPGSAGPAS